MGAFCSKKKSFRILIQGLDAAGKTSLLYRLKLGEVVTTIPTIGFNVEQISVAGLDIVCWDVGGRDKIRPLYRHYYPNTDGFVYVIDSNDKERLDESIDELNRFIFQEEETQNTVVMVLANKQDIDTALPVETIEKRVREKTSVNGATLGGRSLFVKGCSAITKEGLYEAFSEFVEQIRLQKAEKLPPGFLKFDSTTTMEGTDKKSNIQATGEKNGNHFHFLKKFLDISFLKSILFY